MNVIKNLNFGWRYYKSFKEEYLTEDVDGEYEVVNIPHTNVELPYNNFDENAYQFVSCYRKNIDIPREYEDKILILSFEAVASYAKIYVNGKFAGEHKGGYTPFDIKIDGLVNYGEKNEIVVVVDSTERKEIPPFGGVIDYLTYGGIYREVYLKVYEKVYIEDVFIKTSDVLKTEKKLDISVKIAGADEGLSLYYEIVDGKDVIGKFHNSVDLSKSSTSEAIAKVRGLKLWSIDEPKLYTLNVILMKDDVILHKEAVSFGVREAEFKSDGFYLNGKKLKLRGLNRHQCFPYVGYAMPKSQQEKDAVILKEQLGVNIVRTSHYPQSRHFLNKCDEIGLLVFTEIPGWQHIGMSDEWKNLALQNVKEMIIRDRNHPSIILWGVRINESVDCDELYEKTNELAHKLDNTRQTGGVRNFAGSRIFEDVYTYNDFIHRGDNSGLDVPHKIKKNASVPYLVTEHNGHMFPTKRFDNEEKRVEQALRHLRVMNDMYGTNNISGAIGWCMFDYNTHKDFGSGDRICYHGVMDMFRIPKAAAYAYASQQDKYPIMEVTSTMDIGEHPGGNIGDIYVFTNCDYIKVYKNNRYVSTFYPRKKEFGNLPHPPIVIDDLIGDAIEENEGLSRSDAEIMKSVLKQAGKYGMDMPLKSKAQMGYLMAKYKISMDDAVKFGQKYMANWGCAQNSYRFEGYKNNMLVKTVIKEAVKKAGLRIAADSLCLVEKETYEVTRIVIEAVDQNGNVLPYANNGLSVSTDGAVELIGSGIVSLIGGARAVYVKTIGKSGKGTVTINSESLGNCRIELNVIKTEAEDIEKTTV